jgi:DUF438 domain-containing protein
MDRETELAKIILDMSTQSMNQPVVGRAKEILASADSREVAHAQQRVLEAGMDLDDLFTTWQQNRRILPDMEAAMRRELPDNHLVQRILAEHDMILCFVADLEEVNIRVQQLDFASSSNTEIRKLEHIVSHLARAGGHPEREDQVIFPELLRRGFPGPGEIISLQHQQLSVRIEELQQLVWAVDHVAFDAFKTRLQGLVEYIIPVLRRHIFIENNLILPLSLEVIDNPAHWAHMKEVCDEIGYCGYDAC